MKGGDGTAGEVCALGEGAAVDVSPVMGKGFDLSGITTVAQAGRSLRTSARPTLIQGTESACLYLCAFY